MADFTHKGTKIELTEDGQFEYHTPNGTAVRKPSLVAAQRAIDKTAGKVIVLAMDSTGRQFQIAGRHKVGYVDPDGAGVAKHQKLYPYNAEAAAKLADIREREQDEDSRHRDAKDAIRDERFALYRELSDFNYEAEAARLAPQAPEVPTDE